MHCVIIGASAAGISAAKTLRNVDKDVKITIISKDDKVHSRCMLHHVLSGHRTEEEISFISEDFFTKNNIKWKKNTEVLRIDTDAKKVITNAKKLLTAQKIKYDKLLIAAGAQYFIPPIGNLREAKNVFGFRDLSDVRKIEKALVGAKKCILVGSGLVGLDAVNGLLERGIECTVVEMADRICPLQLDNTAAKTYQQLFEKAGAKFLLDEKAADTTMNEEGKITALHLASGKTLECDFLIVAAGVRPALGVVNDSKIEVGRAINVNEFMQTNVDDVWAAGDIAGLTGIWPNAMDQGNLCAYNMLGIKQMYLNSYGLKNTMNFYGLTTLSVGSNVIEEGDNVYVRESKNNYQKIIVRNGIPVHVCFQGDINYLGIWQELIKRKINISGLEDKIFDIGYEDFYQYDTTTGAYEWN